MDLFLEGVLDDVKALSLDTLVDTCNYFSFAEVHNNSGNVSETFMPPITLTCRMDSPVDRLIPQKQKDDIDVQKILRSFYLDANNPNNIVFKESDELESDAGSVGIVKRYVVLDVATETEEADIVLLVMIKT